MSEAQRCNAQSCTDQALNEVVEVVMSKSMSEAATPKASPVRSRSNRAARAARADSKGSKDGSKDEGTVRSRRGVSTREEILEAARNSFAKRGYEASSLDSIAADCEVRKQTVLYYFGSKESLLEAVIDRTLEELSAALLAVVERKGTGGAGARGTDSEGAASAGAAGAAGSDGTDLEEAARAGAAGSGGWDVIRSVVKEVFAIAVRRPEMLGLLREVTRLGEPWTTRVRLGFEPLADRAVGFLEAETSAGRIRRSDPKLILVSAYSKVMGAATEVEVQRALGVEPTLRETARRRRELLDFLHTSLVG